MSRPLRIEFDGAWYHVINRGTGRRKIFLDHYDRKKFFSLLNEIHEIWNIEIHAYSLMDNHYHLLAHTPNSSLSQAMRHLNGIYAQFLNKKLRRDGPLFRGRFKSTLVDEENYLLELVRYIHLNPVKAKICEKAQHHPWTSHQYYIKPESKKKPKWLILDYVLKKFANDYKNAAKKLDKFVLTNSAFDIYKILDSKKPPSILGSDGFKDWIEYNFNKKLQPKKEIPEIKRIKRKPVKIKQIISFTASHYQLKSNDIKKGKRAKKNEARQLAIYLARQLTGLPYATIAKEFMDISIDGVSKAIQRAKARIVVDPIYREESNAIASLILSNVRT